MREPWDVIVRPGRRIRDASEGAGPQRDPQAGLDEQLLHLGRAQPGRVAPRERPVALLLRLAPLALRAARLDDDGLQRAACAAVDGRHAAGGRGRVAHAGHLLVLEQQLAAPHAVAHRDVHRRTQPDEVRRNERHVPRRRRPLDLLDRLAG